MSNIVSDYWNQPTTRKGVVITEINNKQNLMDNRVINSSLVIIYLNVHQHRYDVSLWEIIVGGFILHNYVDLT